MNRRSRAEKFVEEKLAREQPPWLPMPCPDPKPSGAVEDSTERASKLSLEEWLEYRDRHARHLEEVPDYDDGFHRPAPETAEKVWNLLGLNLDDVRPPLPRSWDLTPAELGALALTTKQAVLVVLDRVVRAGRRRRTLTLNHVFDALAEKWSDHYRKALKEGPATRVRDMQEETASASWRDLIRAGLRFKALWRIAMGVGNPLYYVERLERSGHQVKLIKSPLLEQFEDLASALDSGRPFLTRADPLPPRPSRQEVCAERPYNVVRLGERSERLLDVQEETRLIFNVVAFREDYREAKGKVEEIQREFREAYGVDRDGHALVDPETSDYRPKPRKAKKGKKPYYPPSRRQKEIREHVPKDQRRAVYARLEEYDRLRAVTANFRGVWEQLPPERPTAEWVRPFVEGKGILDDQELGMLWPFTRRFPIKTRFVRLINRRYQPTHFWPLAVSAKPREEDWEEEEGEDFGPVLPDSFRERWFQYGGLPWEQDEVPHLKLVGLDISSSQTQILATFLGVKDLEEVASSSELPFKKYLAREAWRTAGNVLKEGYEGPDDDKLIKLVKNLWMRVLYGSEVRQVVRDQRKDRSTYGPGWDEKDATRFLKSLPWYEKVQQFLDACQQLAKIAWDEDPFAGVIFTDPFDGAEVRWNPVERVEVPLSRDGQKLYLSLPGRWVGPSGFREAGRTDEGDYPVDCKRLGRMVAPCLVHTLDAYFSSLMLERLTANHRDVVGIHDGWHMLVPHDLVERAETFIEQVISDAGREWFEGLGPIYDRLADYLDPDPTFGPLVRQWRAAWEARVQEERWPIFAAESGP